MSATLDEKMWWTADAHLDELREVVRSYDGDRLLHCIDIFGYSGKVAKQWQSKNFKAEQYDILRGGRAHDILSKRGFLHLLRSLDPKIRVSFLNDDQRPVFQDVSIMFHHFLFVPCASQNTAQRADRFHHQASFHLLLGLGLKLLPGGAVIGGPPCALNIYLFFGRKF